MLHDSHPNKRWVCNNSTNFKVITAWVESNPCYAFPSFEPDFHGMKKKIWNFELKIGKLWFFQIGEQGIVYDQTFRDWFPWKWVNWCGGHEVV